MIKWVKFKQQLKWRAVLHMKAGVLSFYPNDEDLSTFCKISTAFGDCKCNQKYARWTYPKNGHEDKMNSDEASSKDMEYIWI